MCIYSLYETAGDATLPISLPPTVIDYSGPCSELDTAEDNYYIRHTIRYILEKSVVYSNNFDP